LSWVRAPSATPSFKHVAQPLSVGLFALWDVAWLLRSNQRYGNLPLNLPFEKMIISL